MTAKSVLLRPQGVPPLAPSPCYATDAVSCTNVDD